MATAAKTTRNVSSVLRGEQLWRYSLILILIGMTIAGYMTIAKLTNQSMVCPVESAIFDCGKVESSPWARILGYPTALWGLGAYTAIFALLLLEKRTAFFHENGVMLIFGLVLFAFIYHCYLTLTAAFTIRAFCIWCLAAHATTTVQLVVTGLRLRHSLKAQTA